LSKKKSVTWCLDCILEGEVYAGGGGGSRSL